MTPRIVSSTLISLPLFSTETVLRRLSSNWLAQHQKTRGRGITCHNFAKRVTTAYVHGCRLEQESLTSQKYPSLTGYPSPHPPSEARCSRDRTASSREGTIHARTTPKRCARPGRSTLSPDPERLSGRPRGSPLSTSAREPASPGTVRAQQGSQPARGTGTRRKSTQGRIIRVNVASSANTNVRPSDMPPSWRDGGGQGDIVSSGTSSRGETGLKTPPVRIDLVETHVDGCRSTHTVPEQWSEI